MKDLNAADATIVKTIFLKAPPETVWAHLTEADKLGVWFHAAAADLSEGEDYQLLDSKGEKLCWGRVTRMEAPHRLSYTFTVGMFEGAVTDVDWTLEPVHGGTRLSLVHTGLPQGEDGFGLLTAFDAGWDKHLLKLREA